MWATIRKRPPTEDVQIGSFLREVVVYLRFLCLPCKSTYKIVQIDLCPFTWKSTRESLFKDQSNFLWGSFHQLL